MTIVMNVKLVVIANLPAVVIAFLLYGTFITTNKVSPLFVISKIYTSSKTFWGLSLFIMLFQFAVITHTS